VLVDNIVTLPDLNISAPIGGFGSVSEFAIDTLAIMDPQDGNAWGDDPSIVADITYENIWFNETADEPVAEPGALSLLALGAAGLLRRRKHRA
jgi:MYXO-CTERM domain-containing protein